MIRPISNVIPTSSKYAYNAINKAKKLMQNPIPTVRNMFYGAMIAGALTFAACGNQNKYTDNVRLYEISKYENKILKDRSTISEALDLTNTKSERTKRQAQIDDIYQLLGTYAAPMVFQMNLDQERFLMAAEEQVNAGRIPADKMNSIIKDSQDVFDDTSDFFEKYFEKADENTKPTVEDCKEAISAFYDYANKKYNLNLSVDKGIESLDMVSSLAWILAESAQNKSLEEEKPNFFEKMYSVSDFIQNERDLIRNAELQIYNKIGLKYLEYIEENGEKTGWSPLIDIILSPTDGSINNN